MQRKTIPLGKCVGAEGNTFVFFEVPSLPGFGPNLILSRGITPTVSKYHPEIQGTGQLLSAA